MENQRQSPNSARSATEAPLSDPRVKSLGLEKSPTSLRGPLAQLWSDANDNAEKLSLRGHAYDILNISIYCLSIMKHVMLM
jgi:hypothetical protein